MIYDRRKFICVAGKVGIASAFFPKQLLAKQRNIGHNECSRDGFETRVNDWFYLHDDETNQGNLELIGVKDEMSCKDIEQFSLTFRSNLHARAMPSGYYRVSAERFDLFVQHTHEQGNKQFYRAEFSLLQTR